MLNQQQQQAAQRAADLMAKDYHCSEAIFLAVGQHVLGDVSEGMVKMTTPFAGGVGCLHTDLCGALTGGLMVIGARDGRTDSAINDDQCQKLAADFRTAFKAKFGSVICEDLKKGACGQLTKEAAELLLEMLEE
jgi:C_GCAxxG_C_C family probable redox protein